MESNTTLILKQIRELVYDYGRICLFALALFVCVCLSIYLSRFIPTEVFETTITLALHLTVMIVAIVGAIVLQWHIYGIRARRTWQVCLIIWAVIEIIMMVLEKAFDISTIIFGVHTIEMQDLLVRDILACLLLAYPIEVLYPKYMNLRRGLLMIVPPFIICGLDYMLVAEDLRALLIFYPLVISGILITKIHAYRKTLEENHSSIENSAIPWLRVYMVILIMQGLMYIYLCFTNHPTRIFTQQWLVLALIVYNTAQIIARKNPWKEIPQDTDSEDTDNSWQDYRVTLDEWMTTEKPYLNKDFRLQDLMKVLPLNRTYLSSFINAEYGCNFYQYVNSYRIEEAKQLMQTHPDMRLQDVAEQTGFSSASVFSRTFARETGYSPTEWLEKNFNNSSKI